MENYITVDVEDLEVDLKVIFKVVSTGIGAYEYWGQQCYDKGYPEPEIEEVEWDKSQYNEEENKIIDSYVDKNLDSIYESIEF